MIRDSNIYAKEQQIKLIDNILRSLCSLELSADGRKYLNKMKQRITIEIVQLKYAASKQIRETTLKQDGEKSVFQNGFKALW